MDGLPSAGSESSPASLAQRCREGAVHLIIPEAEAEGRGYPGPREVKIASPEIPAHGFLWALLAFGSHRFGRDDG
jgi:hypothetical protein